MAEIPDINEMARDIAEKALSTEVEVCGEKATLRDVLKLLACQNAQLKELLRLALEEMHPICDHCEYREKYDGSGVCYSVCKWKRYDDAMKLVGGEKDA